MKAFIIKISIGFCLVVCTGIGDNSILNSAVTIDENRLLERHNYHREKLGIPPLSWSDDLANSAQALANELAKKCEMKHSNLSVGENLYWNSNFATEFEVVDYWASEERFFDHKKREFKMSQVSLYGHYSQIIWSETTHVGGAKQRCKHGGEIWVCHYSPRGNMIGSMVY